MFAMQYSQCTHAQLSSEFMCLVSGRSNRLLRASCRFLGGIGEQGYSFPREHLNECQILRGTKTILGNMEHKKIFSLLFSWKRVTSQQVPSRGSQLVKDRSGLLIRGC